jgi:DNA-binding transcriptional LysR family regulator
MPLDLDQLQTFCAIADCGSFTEAARRVHKTQPAVSTQVKRLEQRLGNPLFSRGGRGIALTGQGELLYALARRMLQLNAEIVDLLTGQPLRGIVHLGIPSDYAAGMVPAVLASFRQTHPQVTVNVSCLVSSALLEGLRSGQFDIITFTQGTEHEYGELFRVEPLVWVAAEAGRGLAENPLPIVCGGPDCAWRQDAVNQLKRSGRAFRIAYTSTDMLVVAGIVEADLAIGYLPESAVRPGLCVVPDDKGLPRLSDAQIGLLRAGHAYGGIYDALAEKIVQGGRNLPSRVLPPSVDPVWLM